MKSILVDNRISEECERSLLRLGFTVMKLPACKALPKAIESHADTLIFKHQNDLFTYADYCEAASYVFSDLRYFYPKLKIHFTSDVPKDNFPDDCKLNALVMNGRLFARGDSLSDAVLSFAKKSGLSIVNVKQGYPACSVLRLSDTHAITADKGLAGALERNGISVSLIQSGEIELFPYEYGFIGGACCVFKDTVYFFGDYTLHPDKEKIEEAARAAGVSLYSLSKHPLVDLGGALFLE